MAWSPEDQAAYEAQGSFGKEEHAAVAGPDPLAAAAGPDPLAAQPMIQFSPTAASAVMQRLERGPHLCQ